MSPAASHTHLSLTSLLTSLGIAIIVANATAVVAVTDLGPVRGLRHFAHARTARVAFITGPYNIFLRDNSIYLGRRAAV